MAWNINFQIFIQYDIDNIQKYLLSTNVEKFYQIYEHQFHLNTLLDFYYFPHETFWEESRIRKDGAISYVQVRYQSIEEFILSKAYLYNLLLS